MENLSMFRSYFKFNMFCVLAKVIFVPFRVPQVTYLPGPIIYVTCRALAPPSLPAMNMNASSFLVQAFICTGKNQGDNSNDLSKEYIFTNPTIPGCTFIFKLPSSEHLGLTNWDSLSNLHALFALARIRPMEARVGMQKFSSLSWVISEMSIIFQT